jgi:hypothetical protein
MDLSKKYIKMCKKAEEIQREWRPRIGDFIYDIDYKKIYVITGNPMDELYEVTKPILVNETNFKERDIWLPRIDQLQEMLLSTDLSIEWQVILDEFYEFLHLLSTPIFTSMEQLWLAFVIWEKYKKAWNNEKEEWVDETNY